MNETETEQIALEPAHTLLEAPKKRVPFWVGIFILAILTLIFVSIAYLLREIQTTKEVPVEQNIAVEIPSPYNDLSLEAKSIVVWDVANQKILFAKNENDVLPLASLTKVMATLVATDLIPGYTTIIIEKDFLNAEGDSGLLLNEKWSFKDLSKFSLTVSSNDGMRAIASVAGAVLSSTSGTDEYETGRNAFIARMNKKAEQLGLTTMSFKNETGLDVNEALGGAHGSAYDMARLFEYTMSSYPDVIESTREVSFKVSSLSKFSHNATNTNPYVSAIPGIIASKTGFTDLSGGNLVIAFNPELKRPIIISVLGSSYEGRFTDTLKLVDATLDLIKREDR